MDKIKVLHVLKSKIFSGAENVATSIIKAMPDDVESIYLAAQGPIEDKLKEMEINYILLPKVDAKSLKKVIDDVKPDIIHAHDFGCSVMSAKVAGKIPVISHLHSNPDFIQTIGVKSFAYFWFCKKYFRILTVSESVEEEAWFKKSIKGRVEVIGNPFSAKKILNKAGLNFGSSWEGSCGPVDHVQERPSRETRQVSPQVTERSTSDLIYVGRLVPEKNPLDFIRIVAGVRDRAPQIKATMVGDGELMEECRALIDELQLKDVIKMVGFQSNPYTYIRDSKILVMPSIYEGFGLVALEAFVLGKPVLGSKVGGLQQIITENCGYVCGNEKANVDKDIFISKAAELLLNDEVYIRKSHAARERGMSYDNYENYMEKILNIYKEIN